MAFLHLLPRIFVASLLMVGAIAPAQAVVSVAPVPSVEETLTRFGPPMYDASRQLITMRYVGPEPNVRYHALSAKHHYYDFHGARLVDPRTAQLEPEGVVGRIALAERLGNTVRLAFNLNTPGRPVLRVDPHERLVKIFPAGCTSGEGCTTAIGRPSFGPEGVTVPYTGPAPAYRMQVSQQRPDALEIDFSDVVLGLGPERQGRLSGDMFDSWEVARLPDGRLRMWLRLERSAVVTSEARPEQQQLRFKAREAQAAGERGVAVTVEAPAATITTTPAPAQQVSGTQGAKTTFDRIFYDESRQVLAMPFGGATPRFIVSQLAPERVRLEFPGSEIAARNHVVQTLKDHPLLTAWEAHEVAGEKSVQVTVGLSHPGDLLVAQDSARRQLLIIPQLHMRLSGFPPKGGPVQTVLGRMFFDAKAGALAVPYFGQTPLFATELVGQSHLYMDFLNTAIDPAGVQFGDVPDYPLVSFWLAAKHASRDAVRVAFHMPYGGHVQVVDDAKNRRLLLLPQLGLPPADKGPVKAPAEAAPSASPASPAPSASPASWLGF